MDYAMVIEEQGEQAQRGISDKKNKGLKPQEPRLIGRLIARDGGFTSAGVAVVLLLVISLLFSAAQVRWISTTSADIQFVADAGALAAQNVVAEYEVIAQVADAVVLSMSLFGIMVYGVAIVLSCIPYCEEAGVKLFDFGRKVFDARDKVSEQAANMLNLLQKALPFLCAANASRVISGNQTSTDSSVRYIGLAIPLPLTGEEVGFPDNDEARSHEDELADKNAETSELSDEAGKAKEKMDESKYEGWFADCGSSPRSMQERAGSLGGLSGAQNPYYSSPDLWEFEYALNRVKTYYQARLNNEVPASASLEDQVKYFVHIRFFTFVVKEMAGAYAHVNADGTLDAYFPSIPHSPSELRSTTLYTEAVYPVCGNEMIHGSPKCPSYNEHGAAGYGSLEQQERGVYRKCDTCDFDISTIGNVANITTNTSSGFEYHYRKVKEAAEHYQQAAKEFAENSSEAKESAQKAFSIFETLLEAIRVPRLQAHPPGRNGCIAVVIDFSSHSVPSVFSSSLVGGDASLQPRLAISAAAMAADEASFGDNVISSFLDRVKEDAGHEGAGSFSLGSIVTWFFDGVLDIWGNALLAYNYGIDSLVKGVGGIIRVIPVVGGPLASWAENALTDSLKALGLYGAALSTPKPVLVNSLHVARASDSLFGDVLVGAQEAYSSFTEFGSANLGPELANSLIKEFETRGAEFLESEFTLFTISFGDFPGLPEIPITISLPDKLIDEGKSVLADISSRLSSLFIGEGTNAVWE